MTAIIPPTADELVQKLLTLGRQVRQTVIAAHHNNAELTGVARQTSADAIYQIDTHVEPAIEQFCRDLAKTTPVILIAEGIGPPGHEGKAIFPTGTPESAAPFRLLIDPIDGTRGLMYDKRPAWFLAGIAPNRGQATRLSDIFAAVQVELPTSKQGSADLFWAIQGRGAQALRENLTTHQTQPLKIQSSRADNIDHAFASVANFFPGTKVLASRLMEEIARACLGPADVSRPTVFDDQYLSTGGQLYELMMGHDRFIADLRPSFFKILGLSSGMAVHPYDLAALLIPREAGIIITDGLGGPLDGPLDVDSSLQWAGYANKALQTRIESVIVRTIENWLKNGPDAVKD